MSDQFHKYDDYEEINDESDKFTQGIHLHNQFKKSVGFADEFLRKKLRRRKIIRITSLAAIILLLPFAGYMSYNYFTSTSGGTTATVAVNNTPSTTETKPSIIVADKVLDIIVCEKMEAPDASKASDALIKEFGDKFNANIYSGNYSSNGVKSIPVSTNLKTDLYNALCNNTAKVAPENLSKLLKQMIYSPKDAKLPSNMVVLNNLTDVMRYVNRTKTYTLDIIDFEKINIQYKSIALVKINSKINETTKRLISSELITISKNKYGN